MESLTTIFLSSLNEQTTEISLSPWGKWRDKPILKNSSRDANLKNYHWKWVLLGERWIEAKKHSLHSFVVLVHLWIICEKLPYLNPGVNMEFLSQKWWNDSDAPHIDSGLAL